MRLKNYPRINTLSSDTVFITDSTEKGTKGITAERLANCLLSMRGNSDSSVYAWCDQNNVPASIRRKVYRGENLGNSLTPLQKEEIKNGTFTNMFVGDYWEFPNENKYIIADFDYYMGYTGSGYGEEHHLLMIFDNYPNTVAVNETASVDYGFGECDIAYNNLPAIREGWIEYDFGEDSCLPFWNTQQLGAEEGYGTYYGTSKNKISLFKESMLSIPTDSNLDISVCELKPIALVNCVGIPRGFVTWLSRNEYSQSGGLKTRCIMNDSNGISSSTYGISRVYLDYCSFETSNSWLPIKPYFCLGWTETDTE